MIAHSCWTKSLERFVIGAGAVGVCLGLCWTACAAPGAGEWTSYNGNLRSDRFSPLVGITPGNVADLREVCEASLGDPGSFQSGPVVIDGTLFVTTVHTTVAIDATQCKVRWRHVYSAIGDEPFPGNR